MKIFEIGVCMKTILKIAAFFFIFFIANFVLGQQTNSQSLQNDLLKVEFNDSGLVSIFDIALNQQVQLKEDNFSILLDGQKISSNGLKPTISKDAATVSYS